MDKVDTYEKKLGETPLEAIGRYREENDIPGEIKIAYAGRLDPMAQGELLLLIGEACKRRDEYQGLSKIYAFEMMIGVATDSYDLLGKITNKKSVDAPLNQIEVTQSFLDLNGTFMQEYPPYSSYHVDGKPLWWWAKNNKLNEIALPKKEVTVTDAKLRDIKIWDKRIVENEIIRRIDLVKGNFRQEEIKDAWLKYFAEMGEEKITIVGGIATVTSGTYIRGLTKNFEESLGFPAVVFSIDRKEVLV